MAGPHKHDKYCYVDELRCAIEENHSHGNNCYVEVQDSRKRSSKFQLSCYKPEGHGHGNSCYIKVLGCRHGSL